MKTYRIIATTNGYIANRDVMFKGKTEVILHRNMTLKEACQELLNMYNYYFYECDNRPYACNWGMAVIQSKNHTFGARATYSDGTRSFDWDSRRFSIEEETE